MPNPYAARKLSTKRNLGKHLERLIDMTNKQYKNKGVADVRKIPTPVQITGNDKGRITGRLQRGEWVDYVGVGSGRVLVFDAKETSVDRFELKNLHQHQFELLESWYQKGACSFLIVSFVKKHEEIYLLPFDILAEAWEGYVGDGRKSIPYQTFVEKCDRIRSDRGYVLHYLKPLERG